MKKHIERMKRLGEKIEKEQGEKRHEYSIHYEPHYDAKLN